MPDTVLFLNDSKVTGINSGKDIRAHTIENYALVAYRTNSDGINYRLYSTHDFVVFDSGEILLPDVNFDDIRTVTYQPIRKLIGILTFDSLYLYSTVHQQIQAQLPLRRVNYLELTRESIFATAYYNYNRMDRKNPFTIYKLDYNLMLLDSFMAKPDFIEYTHYTPSHLFSANSSFIAYPLLGEYGVVVLDHKLKVIDTLKRKTDSWIEPSSKLSKLIALNGGNASPYFDVLDKENYSNISRIEYIQFISDSTLLVRWFNYDSLLSSFPLRHIDIYSVSEDSGISFSLLDSYLEDRFPFDTKKNIDSAGFPVMSWTNFSSYFPDGILQIKPEFEGVRYKNLSYKDYFMLREENSLIKDPMLSVWFFRIK